MPKSKIVESDSGHNFITVIGCMQEAICGLERFLIWKELLRLTPEEYDTLIKAHDIIDRELEDLKDEMEDIFFKE